MGKAETYKKHIKKARKIKENGKLRKRGRNGVLKLFENT
jgi:hypothetical protein